MIAYVLWRKRRIFSFAPIFNFHPERNSLNFKIRQRMKHSEYNEDFALLADKYKVREYVKSKTKRVKLPKLLFESQNPKTIPFDDLPESYVIKANHGSGWNIIIKKNQDLSTKKTVNNDYQQEIIKKCQKWLTRTYRNKFLFKQPHYSYIHPQRIIIEEFLEDEEGKVPRDYKFFVFHGKVQLIEVDYDRFGNHTRDIMSPEWKKIPVELGYKSDPDNHPKPKLFDQMLQAAEELAVDFPFIRVDLYEVDDEIYFSEFTVTPGGGVVLFRPKHYDLKFGKYW